MKAPQGDFYEVLTGKLSKLLELGGFVRGVPDLRGFTVMGAFSPRFQRPLAAKSYVGCKYVSEVEERYALVGLRLRERPRSEKRSMFRPSSLI